MYLALVDPCDHCVNETQNWETKDSSLKINFALETPDQTQPGFLSLTLQGWVGENPGNEVGKEHLWIMKGFQFHQDGGL